MENVVLNKADLNIMLTVTDSYIPYAAVTIQSIKDSNKDILIDVYVICLDVSAENKKKLLSQFDHSKVVKKGGVRVIFPEISESVVRELEEVGKYLLKWHNTSFLLRLYATQILPESVLQVLYMDVDIIVSSSLKELAEMILHDDTAFAAVKDLVRSDDYSRLGLDENKQIYINSGVLLMNLKYWRKNKVGHECIEKLTKYSTLYKMPDQDALNVVCQGHIEYLHPKYNCLSLFYARREFLKIRIRKEEYDRVKEAIEQPAIIHYVFVNKPWFKGEYLPKRELWLEALSKTEWRNIPITYRNGLKGRLKYLLKETRSKILPLGGIKCKTDIFYQVRYRHVEFIALLLYFGIGYWLPNFDSRFMGKISNAFRVWCVKNIFDYVGANVKIGRKVKFGNGRKIWIGARSNIGANCFVPPDIIIGDNVMMGPKNFFFMNFTHNISEIDKPMIDQGFHFISGKTEICDDVWIGRECIFMPCVKICSHSVVGARSVVTKDVPQWVVVAGNPAKVVKERK